MDKRLDGSSYRVYLVLQKAIRLRSILSADEIMERAGISRSAYTTAVTKLDELQLLPRLVQNPTKKSTRTRSPRSAPIPTRRKSRSLHQIWPHRPSNRNRTHRNQNHPSLERRDRPHPSQKRKIPQPPKTITFELIAPPKNQSPPSPKNTHKKARP